MPADAQILIVGHGRIARVMEQQLRALGAEVWIASRSPGNEPQMVSTGTYGPVLQTCDAVVNTAPALVLNRAALERTRSDCLILDLASNPGGVDRVAAATLGRRLRWELGLPGRYFPVSAGRVIRRTVRNALARKVV